MPDKANHALNKVSFCLYEASLSPDEVTSNPDIEIDLVLEQEKYKKEKSFNHNEILKKINHYKNF